MNVIEEASVIGDFQQQQQNAHESEVSDNEEEEEDEDPTRHNLEDVKNQFLYSLKINLFTKKNIHLTK